MLSDCNANLNSEEAFEVRIFEDGKVEKIIPSKMRDVRSFSDGIIDLFLTSVRLHEGGENPGTDGCSQKKVESEDSIQLIKVGNIHFSYYIRTYYLYFISRRVI